MKVDLTIWWVKPLLALIVLLAVGASVYGVIAYRDSHRDMKGQIEQDSKTQDAADDIKQEADTAQGQVTKAETGVAEVRVIYQKEYEDAKRDPVVRDWADEPVPQRLRDLARQRREERERLGRPGDGRRGDDEAARAGR
ncbi:hypothetical protein [Corynebacterium sp.]|uniref:hypothetical protein n=1 Tax=Corynebacterium sp. TaxID=1720 RepID=UPI002F40381A